MLLGLRFIGWCVFFVGVGWRLWAGLVDAASPLIGNGEWRRWGLVMLWAGPNLRRLPPEMFLFTVVSYDPSGRFERGRERAFSPAARCKGCIMHERAALFWNLQRSSVPVLLAGCAGLLASGVVV